jgi:hypothetical protein
MCFEYERLESIRKEMEKLEALKKAEDKARPPAKPDVPEEKNIGQRDPVPA